MKHDNFLRLKWNNFCRLHKLYNIAEVKRRQLNLIKNRVRASTELVFSMAPERVLKVVDELPLSRDSYRRQVQRPTD